MYVLTYPGTFLQQHRYDLLVALFSSQKQGSHEILQMRKWSSVVEVKMPIDADAIQETL
jgi:hypothetical protein